LPPMLWIGDCLLERGVRNALAVQHRAAAI
jgi:hypothetical protein